MRSNPNLILRKIYGKNIIMPIRYNEASNDPIYFNEVAAMIWELSDKTANVEELLNSVCQTFGLSDDSAEAAGVKGFIKQLIESKLIIEN